MGKMATPPSHGLASAYQQAATCVGARMPSANPSMSVPSVTDILAAQNMRRLLEAYRTLAPLTIGGPASTSLETAPGQLLRPPATDSQASSVASPPGVRRHQQPNPWSWVAGPRSPLAASDPDNTSSCLAQMVASAPHRQHHHQPAAAEDGIGSGKRLAASRGRHTPTQSSPTFPIFTTKDSDSSSLLETSLDGMRIACFSVGGELRLCLTQILQLVLHSVPLDKIHQACDELQIFCSTCSSSQLTSLKLARVLPVSAPQCGLITRSDAERLCAHLLDGHPTSPSPVSASPEGASGRHQISPSRDSIQSAGSGGSFRVEHRCMGSCVGSLSPQAFTSGDSPCIECLDCGEVLSPVRFVCHSHKPQDRGVVHWGFSRDNWSAYIQVWEDYDEVTRSLYQASLASLKASLANSGQKRKMEDDVVGGAKRWRSEAGSPGEVVQPHPVLHSGVDKGMFSGVDTRGLFPWGMGMEAASCHALHPAYLQSLAHIHTIKILMEQNVARTILQASFSGFNQDIHQMGGRHNPVTSIVDSVARCPPPVGERQHATSNSVSGSGYAPVVGGDIEKREEPRINQKLGETDSDPTRSPEDYLVRVSSALVEAGLNQHSRTKVMDLVERLVTKLLQAEKEKETVKSALKDMEDRVTRLEKEVASKVPLKVESPASEADKQPARQEDDTSSDGGIESGTEVDELSEK